MNIPIKLNEIKETEKAVGIVLKHNDGEKMMWVPKSLIKNNWKQLEQLEIPDWFYDKKVEELFF